MTVLYQCLRFLSFSPIGTHWYNLEQILLKNVKNYQPLTPEIITDQTRKNFRNVQIDAIGVGLANAAAPFLPVFLTHLEASSFQVGMLSSMPAITGILLAIPLGRFLQRQTNIIKWFSIARLMVITCYALTGLISFLIPKEMLVNSILGIWAVATLPQTVVAITFSVVMNAVAGPTRRFELMSRRWSTMGLTTTLIVLAIGQLLDRVIFPLNYQLMFIGMSLGGLISFYYSSHIVLEPVIQPPLTAAKSLKDQFAEFRKLILNEKPFVRFLSKRFIVMTGVQLSAPLIPLYLVRVAKVSDGWISVINMSQTAILVIGYFLWTRQSKRRGTHSVLVWTTLGISLYPLLLTFTTIPWQIAVIAGIAGIFSAGLDLVFFDELMKTVPIEYSAIFVSFAQMMQFLATVIAPLVGTTISDLTSIQTGLLVAFGLRLAGFFGFLLPFHRRKASGN